MHMPTVTIKDTTWAEAKAPSRKTSLRVRPCSVARPRGVFFAAELALLGAAVVGAMWTGGTFELPILIGCCVAALYLKALDSSIVHSSTAQFASDLAEALCWGTAFG